MVVNLASRRFIRLHPLPIAGEDAEPGTMAVIDKMVPGPLPQAQIMLPVGLAPGH